MPGLSGKDATMGIARGGNFFNTSTQLGGMRGPSTYSTGYSTAHLGRVTLDPSIREIQEQALAKNNNLYNELGASGQNILGNLSGLRERYLGNMAAYTQARVNPLEQQLTAREGELRRSVGLRGLSGSSFGDQALTNFDIDKNRALGDARAQAEAENLQALTGIDGQMAQTLFAKTAQQAQINGLDLQAAHERLAGELQAMGLGKDQIQQALEAYTAFQGNATQSRMNVASSVIGGFKAGNSGSSAPSAGSNCVVAEEIYGVNSPITLTIRAFVGKHSNDKTMMGRFFRRYIKNGRQWAYAVKKNATARFFATIIWNKLYKMAVKENGKAI